MSQLKLSDIDPEAIYDADQSAAVLGIHRTTVHRAVFPRIRTQRLGRRDTTTGEQLIQYLRGEAASDV
jgi:hypothetical protein